MDGRDSILDGQKSQRMGQKPWTEGSSKIRVQAICQDGWQLKRYQPLEHRRIHTNEEAFALCSTEHSNFRLGTTSSLGVKRKHRLKIPGNLSSDFTVGLEI